MSSVPRSRIKRHAATWSPSGYHNAYCCRVERGVGHGECTGDCTREALEEAANREAKEAVDAKVGS